MDARKVACFTAAGFVGALLVGAATSPLHGQALQQPVTIEGHRNPDTSLTRVVPYGDLALTSKEGRKVLINRVSAAVTAVCPDFDTDGSQIDVQGCQDFAWDGARPQIRRAFSLARSSQSLAMTISISTAGTK